MIAALGPKADGVGPEFSLRALVEGMTPEMRSDAREKLDALTAGAVRNEILTGRPTGFRRPTFHLKKAEYSIRGLDNVLKQKTLSPADRATAEAIRQDLINALNTDLVILP